MGKKTCTKRSNDCFTSTGCPTRVSLICKEATERNNEKQ